MAKRRGRYSSGRYRIPVRSLILLLTLVLLIGSGIGMTVGFLSTRTEPVQNDFTYGKVSCEVLETFDKENNRYIKRDVRIKNTGNTSAYIRVLLVRVKAQKQVAAIGYTLFLLSAGAFFYR